MQGILLIFALLSLCLPISGEAREEAALDLRDRVAVEFAMLDYPALHVPWVRQQLAVLDRKVEPLLWTRACWALVISNFSQDKAWIAANMSECIRLAKEQRLLLEWVSLRLEEEEEKRRGEESAGFVVKLQPLLDEVRRLDEPDARAFVAAEFADHMLEIRDVDRAMPFVLESNELVDSGRSTSLFVWEETKGTLSKALEYQGFSSKSSEVDETAIKRYRELGARKSLSQALYNRGFSRIFLEKADLVAVQKDFAESLQISTSIQDFFTIGNTYYAQSLILGRANRFPEAIAKIKEALPIFVKLEDTHWITVCKTLLAEFLLNEKKYPDALAILDELDPIVSTESRPQKNYIVHLRYRIAKRQNDWKKALEYLEVHASEEKKLAEIREQDEYNRASVSLGLQLENEKNNILKKENQIQAQKLHEAERFRIFVIILGILSLSTLSLLVLAFRQIQRIRASKQKIQLILDNIDEGLLTVDRRQTIGGDYSKHLDTMLASETSVAGQDFIKTIFHGSLMANEQKSMIHQVLAASFGEEAISWDMNAANLPAEFHRQRQTLGTFVVRWIPIFDRQGKMDQLLVSLSDVTHARALEQALGLQEQRLRQLPHTLREILQAKPDRLRPLLASTETLLDRMDELVDKTVVLRQLHTQKGAARTLGLRALSADLHELETALSTPSWADALAAAQATVREYQTLLDVLHQDQPEVPEVFWLPAAVEPHLSAWLTQMREARLPFRSIQIEDGVLQWRNEDAAIVRDLCLHAINNSLDHGFLLPLKKGQIVASPSLHLSASEGPEGVFVELRDNGVGLDEVQLQALATRRGFVPAVGESLSDLLFIDGISTAESVTLTSGRGVGLAAIKAQVMQRGGTIGIRNQESGPGTVLWVRLPRRQPT